MLQFVEDGSVPFHFLSDSLHLYTDGALKTTRTSTSSGCGIVLLGERVGKTLIGLKPPTHVSLTITAAELYAVYEALSLARTYSKDAVIHTDSAYVWDFFHVIRKRFSLIGFQSFENSELLSKITRICFQIEENHTLYYIKVRGHEGNPHNATLD